MTYVTDAEVIRAIRVMCTSPVYADSDQRVRCILATIEAHQPDDYPAAPELPRNAHGGLDLAALDAQVGLAPMTGAEALDAAATPEEFGAVLNGIFDAFAQAARDEADREHVVRISFNSSKYLVKCDAGDLFEVATRLDEAEIARAAHEAGAS